MNEQQPPPPLWTLQQGIELARRLELIAIENNGHVALGGSVLHSGQSTKDLDIFIYPRKSEKYFSCFAIMDAFGCVQRFASHKYHPEDEKAVYAVNIDGKRVNLFFLQ